MNMKLTRAKKLMLAGLCFAMILGCAGIQTAFAQDVEAVGRRLRAAVQAGELTGEQTWAMMDALLRMADQDQRRGERESNRITREDYARIEAELKKTVEAGRITEKQAKVRLAGAREMIDRQRVTGQEQTDDQKAIEDFGRRIRAAVAAGEMTEEEGREQMAGFRRRLGAREEQDKGDQRIEAEIIRIQADIKAREALKARYEAAAKQIRVDIAEGKITEEQGKARLEELKKRFRIIR